MNYDSVTELLYSGYIISAPVLMLLYWFYKSKRLLWQKLVVTCNILLLVGCTIDGAMWIIHAVPALFTNSDNEFTWRIRGLFWYAYHISFASMLLLPHLLWFKHFRWNMKVSLVLWIVMILVIFIERVGIYYVSNYHDFLPSSWSYYAPDYRQLAIVITVYGIVLVLTYVTLRKYSRLLYHDANEKIEKTRNG